MDLATKYSACSKYSRKQPVSSIDPGLQTELARNFRVMPLYEKAINDHLFSKAHSLKRNDFLHCRWLEYQRIHIAAKPPPFEFPHVSDFHFYNYDTCYKPDLSINVTPSHRFCMTDGPGVDEHGEIPIPSDTGFRKSGMMVDKKRKKKALKKIVKVKRK